MKSKEIAKFAQMCSLEGHTEWMETHNGYTRDILEEMIDKFDKISAMANRKWYDKWITKMFKN